MKDTDSNTLQNPFFISIGCFLAVSFWVFEAYIDTLTIKNVTFAMRLFPSDLNELWMRSFVCVFFVGFGLYAHRVHSRIRLAEKMNLDAAWLLKKAIFKTIRGNYPICVYCKKIRDQDDLWVALDKFIAARTEAEFSPGICKECEIQHPPG